MQTKSVLRQAIHQLGRLLVLLVLTGLSLQLVFFLSIQALRLMPAPSSSFQRSAIWDHLAGPQAGQHPVTWRHQPVDGAHIADSARKAVIASEDNHFFTHQGVDWAAIQSAWRHNANDSSNLRGGSTITQQLAKNLYLSGERSLLRKGQELVLAWMLELTLDKHHILDTYLNTVQWGHALYGIEAAAQHYFGTSAAQLNATQAAQLAVLLPQPLRLGPQLRQGSSRYIPQRARIIVQRMVSISLP